MQDNISTLPTTNDQPNPGDIDLVKSIFSVDTNSPSFSIQILLYVTIIYFVVSTPQVEDFLTRYLEFTCNSAFLLNVTKSVIFFGIAYILFNNVL